MKKDLLLNGGLALSLGLMSSNAIGLSTQDLAGYRSTRAPDITDYNDRPAYSCKINGTEYMVPGNMLCDSDTIVRDIRFEDGKSGRKATLLIGDKTGSKERAVVSICGLYSLQGSVLEESIEEQLGRVIELLGVSLNPGCYSSNPLKGKSYDITQDMLKRVRTMPGNMTISDNGGEGEERMYLPAHLSDDVKSYKIRIPQLGDVTFMVDDGKGVVFSDGTPGNYDFSSLKRAASSIGVTDIKDIVINPPRVVHNKPVKRQKKNSHKSTPVRKNVVEPKIEEPIIEEPIFEPIGITGCTRCTESR
jgi:hypothetical protein